MTELKLTLACDEYDLLQPLRDGSVKPRGIDLRVETYLGGERHDRMLRGDFDLAEFSFASYLVARGKGVPLVGLPVFVRRMFGQRLFFCRDGAGIQNASDLRGKRVCVQRWSNTLALWSKGYLQHFHGVGLEDVEWYAAKAEAINFAPPPGVRLQRLAPGRNQEEMLLNNELDVVITPELFPPFEEKRPGIRRVFPDFAPVEQEYFRETGDFPIMHLIALRDDLARQHPWVVESLLEAFRQARDAALWKLRRPCQVSLAWGRALLEEEEELLGGARWPYNVSGNRASIERLSLYAAEQGLTPRRLGMEDLFPGQAL